MAWALDRIPDLAGRVALVKGANSRIEALSGVSFSLPAGLGGDAANA
jgi:hypothetical protein